MSYDNNFEIEIFVTDRDKLKIDEYYIKSL